MRDDDVSMDGARTTAPFMEVTVLMNVLEKYLESLGLRVDKILKDRGYITSNELYGIIHADMGLVSCDSDALSWPDE